MAFWEFLFGRPEGTQGTLNPQQQGLQNQSIQSALSLLQGMGKNQFDFGPIEQRARKQFGEATVPSLAERFTSLGSGSQGSSAFQGALGSAASDLESSLAALKSQYGLQQQGMQQNLLNSLLGFGLQPSQAYVPRSPGFLESGLSSLAGGAGMAAGQAFPLLQLLSMLGGSANQSSSSMNRLGGGNTSQPQPFNLPTARQALMQRSF